MATQSEESCDPRVSWHAGFFMHQVFKRSNRKPGNCRIEVSQWKQLEVSRLIDCDSRQFDIQPTKRLSAHRHSVPRLIRLVFRFFGIIRKIGISSHDTTGKQGVCSVQIVEKSLFNRREGNEPRKVARMTSSNPQSRCKSNGSDRSTSPVATGFYATSRSALWQRWRVASSGCYGVNYGYNARVSWIPDTCQPLLPAQARREVLEAGAL